MPGYFLDTSALAKLYHNESGSDHVDRIVQERGSQSLISHPSIVEMESVLATKMRTGEIDEPAVEVARRRFRADMAQRRFVVAPPMLERHLQSARLLLVYYGVSEGLRTLDALQLAVALDLLQLGQIEVLVAADVAADQRLCRAASRAGCETLNPEKPGPVVT